MTPSIKKLLEIVRKPTAKELALRELQEAERLLLKHKDAAEFSTAMVAYLETKITRLREYSAGAETRINTDRFTVEVEAR